MSRNSQTPESQTPESQQPDEPLPVAGEAEAAETTTGKAATDEDTTSAPKVELSPLESLRQDVESRLEAVIQVEADVRESVNRLNTRLQPLLKTFRQLEPVMTLSEPAIAKALQMAKSQVEGQVESIERLRTAAAREVHFRDQLADATLGRWQTWRRLHADPAAAWSERLEEKLLTQQGWAANFETELQAHERRWLPQLTPETGLVQQTAPVESGISEETTASSQPQPEEPESGTVEKHSEGKAADADTVSQDPTDAP